VGLVSFSDRPHIQAQPTTDRTAVLEGLDSLQAMGGTAMGDALVEALGLQSEEGRRRAEAAGDRAPLDAVLLLSDGYNTTGRVEPLEAAERARARDVATYTIALGTPEGVVEGQDQFGRPRLVRVPPDHDTLRAIAETTGASFFTAPTQEDLERVYADLGSRIGFVKQRREVTSAFAAAALVLTGAGGALSLAWTGRLP
jgi:Ca-activated chloride channel family protein